MLHSTTQASKMREDNKNGFLPRFAICVTSRHHIMGIGYISGLSLNTISKIQKHPKRHASSSERIGCFFNLFKGEMESEKEVEAIQYGRIG